MFIERFGRIPRGWNLRVWWLDTAWTFSAVGEEGRVDLMCSKGSITLGLLGLCLRCLWESWECVLLLSVNEALSDGNKINLSLW